MTTESLIPPNELAPLTAATARATGSSGLFLPPGSGSASSPVGNPATGLAGTSGRDWRMRPSRSYDRCRVFPLTHSCGIVASQMVDVVASREGMA